jgi:P-type Ca2+ transporter type 2C
MSREAAAIVLLDDDFTSIVAAVHGGRRIFDNLRKAINFIVAVHIPIAALAILPVLFGWPLILLPVHIVFLEFIIDPACTLVFEAEPAEPDIMRRPPRAPDTPLFTMRLLLISVLQGLGVLAAILAMFLIALRVGQTQAEARTLAFAALVVADLALILVNRSWSHTIFETLRRPNLALWLVVGGALTTLALVIYVPFLASLFQFATLHPNDIILCLVTGAASILWFEALKLVQRRIAPARAARPR